MSWSGRESLPYVREWLEGPPRCPGVVGSPYTNVLEWSGGPSDVLEWSGGPPGCPGVV